LSCCVGSTKGMWVEPIRIEPSRMLRSDNINTNWSRFGTGTTSSGRSFWLKTLL
jgi:hypothetical protein